MKNLKVVISSEAPTQKDTIWVKPVTSGFALYLLDAGVWKPMKLVDDQNTQSTIDDTVQNLVGSAGDASTANTINGAKAYADAAAGALLGTPEDTGEEMTLYGLKAYFSQGGGTSK